MLSVLVMLPLPVGPRPKTEDGVVVVVLPVVLVDGVVVVPVDGVVVVVPVDGVVVVPVDGVVPVLVPAALGLAG